jgi:hypothetical protein
MKKLARFATLTTLTASGLGLTSSDVRGATAAATTCSPIFGGPASYGYTGLANQTGATMTVSCPIPIDHQLGTTVIFKAFINDKAEFEQVTCVGKVYNWNGTQLGSTTAVMECINQPGQIECFELRIATTMVSPQSSTNTYTVECSIPGSVSYSGLESVGAW